MNDIVNEIVKKWCDYFISGDKEGISKLFANNAIDTVEVNSVSIDKSRYIIEDRVDKWHKHLDNKMDIYFTLTIKMQFEGMECTCDVVPCHMEAKLIDDTIQILKVDEIDCYLWKLDRLNCVQINSGSLYLAGEISYSLNELEQMCNEVITQMQLNYGKSVLNNIGIIVFGNSKALEGFLEEILPEGYSVGGKAKLNHVFISETKNIARMKQVLRHELTHLVLYRRVKFMDNKEASINPILSESISHLAEEDFNSNIYIPIFKAYLRKNFYNVSMLEDIYVKNMEERQSQIYIGLVLLSYIGEVYGKNYILEFVIEVATLNSVENAIQAMFNISVSDFEFNWNQYIKQVKET